MISLWKWNLRRLMRKIWVPIAAFGLVGLATALAAAAVPPFLPADSKGLVAANAVSAILQIMATSLLTVTTFSVSIMVSAFASAAQGATPRATPLLRDDRLTQNVLATFTGGFIYSLVSIIGLETGLYGREGRLLIFLVTLAVLAAIVWQLVRWIGHLADFGRLPDTIARVETAARAALEQRMAHPYLGGRPLDDGARALARQGQPVFGDRTGYVQVIDLAALNRLCADARVTLALSVLPGSFIHPGSELARLMPGAAPDPALDGAIARTFAIGPTRSLDQDPRFGTLILTEIAQRALSPAVNDPGTAIDILGRHLRVLSAWAERGAAELLYPHVLVPRLRLADLAEDAFAAIARDGAGMVEVQVRLLKTLGALVQLSPAFAPEVAHQTARALDLSAAALVLPEDKDRLRALAQRIAETCRAAQASDAASPALPATA